MHRMILTSVVNIYNNNMPFIIILLYHLTCHFIIFPSHEYVNIFKNKYAVYKHNADNVL